MNDPRIREQMIKRAFATRREIAEALERDTAGFSWEQTQRVTDQIIQLYCAQLIASAQAEVL